jgi:hypothetical protein
MRCAECGSLDRSESGFASVNKTIRKTGGDIVSCAIFHDLITFK